MPIILGIGLAFAFSSSAKEKIRTVELKKDEIVTVKTALTVATIVQVPDRPQSVVVGDSEAFKVEYLDQALTIKPLMSKAKSNLYIYTDYRRFDVALVTGFEKDADYVVYLKPKVTPLKKPDSILWRKFEKSFEADRLSISIKRLGTLRKTGWIEFGLSSKQNIRLDPGVFWLTADSKTLPIEKLTLNTLDVRPNRISLGLIEVNLDHLRTESVIRFEFRSQRSSGVNLPPLKDWR